MVSFDNGVAFDNETNMFENNIRNPGSFSHQSSGVSFDGNLPSLSDDLMVPELDFSIEDESWDCLSDPI